MREREKERERELLQRSGDNKWKYGTQLKGSSEKSQNKSSLLSDSL